jgi:phosphoenolpyruvate carboxykinase (GTP)
MKLDNPELNRFIAEYIEFCNPAAVFVSDDSDGDISHIRTMAVKDGEENDLSINGHRIHYDSFFDQARDKGHTKILVPKGTDLGPLVKTMDRDDGISEIRGILKDMMKGHTLYVCFFCLGPINSEFSIPCVQLTDSSYLAHSETILYRKGYEEFVRQGRSAKFFKFVHSQGEVDERKVCKNLDERRVYIDIQDSIVYSTNSQYGGNAIGLKKLAMRLAINRGSGEGWLTEHMLVMGIKGPNDRTTYFTGAFPSLCGKTSTAMLDGEKIVGDDIAYLRKRDGKVKAVNVENGMFGIIQGVNSKDDPIQWNALHSPGEVIFSNVLVTKDKSLHWIGKDGDTPEKGVNHSGDWWIGKKDEKGNEITSSHPNARFTINLNMFENLDPKIQDPEGCLISGIVYGGRDSDTWVPVEESFDWTSGVIEKGGSLESETTAATLGKAGVRKFNPMSNLDFLSIPVGKYIQANLDFAQGLDNPPRIFSVNYFLKGKDGDFLNEKTDKKVWYKWMELRVNGDVDAIDTPTGRIPKYDDIKKLFKSVLNKDYTEKEYEKQFTIRVNENLAKIERVKEVYETKVPDAPGIIFEVLEGQKMRLLEAKEKLGDYISPWKLANP